MKSLRQKNFWVLGIISLTTASFAAEPVQTWLARPIIGSTQTLAEVQAFCEKRVPPMPEVNSAKKWERIAEKLRRETLEKVVFRGEAARWRDAKTKVEWLDTIEGGPGYRIKKLRFEALPGFWIPALLYEPEKISGKVPVVLNVHGHEPAGKIVAYEQIRCINLAKRGMLVLKLDWVGMGQLNGADYNHTRMNQIDLCGASGLSVFYLAMSRGLDLLAALDHADKKRVAMAGLSGGGWQTIYLSALDTRVTLANPVAGYSSFITRARHPEDVGDSEQAPCDMATVVDYTHFTAMLAPRAALLTYNFKDDCCFASPYALPPLLAAAEPIFKLYGKEKNLRSYVNHDPGTHNFDRDNREQFYKMIGDFFYPGDAKFSAKEIASADEIKPDTQLYVPLPTNNATFNTLALGLSKSLPRVVDLNPKRFIPGDWPKTERPKHSERLQQVVRAPKYSVTATKLSSEEKDGVTSVFWKLKVGEEWSVPVVEFSRNKVKGVTSLMGEAELKDMPAKWVEILNGVKVTTVLIGDAGRKNLTADVERYLDAGRVLVVDLFNFGEAKVASRYPLFVDTVGARPLGIQAAQLNAVTKWAFGSPQNEPRMFIAAANGPRSSLIALVAAGLPGGRFHRVELQGSLTSLKELIQKNRPVNEMPEMFCFGLLKEFDMPQLEMLAGGVVKR